MSNLSILFYSRLILTLSFTNILAMASVKEDSSLMFKDEDSLKVIKYGTIITGSLILLRESVVNPLQEDIAEKEPLGDLAPVGDYMGQLIPNITYSLYMHYTGDKRRRNLMFKTSLYAGLTTGILKRIVNQRRPHKGDRLSFPSGHTTTAFAFASVASLEHPRWTYEAYGLAVLVGFSRMNDNAHYLHDVVAGATIGMAYGYAFYNQSQKFKTALIPYRDGAFINLAQKF